MQESGQFSEEEIRAFLKQHPDLLSPRMVSAWKDGNGSPTIKGKKSKKGKFK